MLLLAGAQTSALHVPYEQASAAYQQWCAADGHVDRSAGERYLGLLGWRYFLLNCGSSLLAAATTSAMLCAVLRFTSREEGTPWARTPSGIGGFLALGALAMLLLIPGVSYGLEQDLRRQLFPSCADSIGIPIFGLSTLVLVATPVLAIVGWIAGFAFGSLPASLSVWDERRPLKSWLVTLATGAAALTTAAGFVLSMASADIIAPSAVIALYLIASTRAALLAPRRSQDSLSGPVRAP